MRPSFARFARLAAPVIVAVTAAACGTTAGPTPLPAPPPPKQASITVTASNAVVGLSPLVGFNFRLAFDLGAREAGGLGAKVNFIRCEFLDASGNEVERQEVGSNTLGRIEANGSLSGRIIVDFNDGRSASARVRVSFTDDGGHTLEATITIGLV